MAVIRVSMRGEGEDGAGKTYCLGCHAGLLFVKGESDVLCKVDDICCRLFHGEILQSLRVEAIVRGRPSEITIWGCQQLQELEY